MSDLAIILVGVGLFVITTVASLWTGYLVFQRNWVAQNLDLTDPHDDITPLFKDAYSDEELGVGPSN